MRGHALPLFAESGDSQGNHVAKATMDVPSTTAGRIRELKVQRGARVSQGDVIAVVEAAASAAPAAASAPAPVSAQAPAPAREVARSPGESPERKPPPQPAAPQAPDGVKASAGTIDEPGFARAHASPTIRKLARELGVDLTRVQGSGEKGRITDVDVKAYVKRILSSGGAATPGGAALPRVPVVDFAAFGPVERKPLTRIQRISGPRLHASWAQPAARHAVRRGRHHRDGAGPRQPEAAGDRTRPQADAARVRDPGLRPGDAAVSAILRIARRIRNCGCCSQKFCSFCACWAVAPRSSRNSHARCPGNWNRKSHSKLPPENFLNAVNADTTDRFVDGSGSRSATFWSHPLQVARPGRPTGRRLLTRHARLVFGCQPFRATLLTRGQRPVGGVGGPAHVSCTPRGTRAAAGGTARSSRYADADPNTEITQQARTEAGNGKSIAAGVDQGLLGIKEIRSDFIAHFQHADHRVRIGRGWLRLAENGLGCQGCQRRRSVRETLLPHGDIDHHLSRLQIIPRVIYEEPFHFMQSRIISAPMGLQVRTLAEFREVLAGVDASVIYYHTFEAILRLGKPKGDFALWMEEQLGLPELGERISKIDPYRISLESVRSRILNLCDQFLQNGRDRK